MGEVGYLRGFRVFLSPGTGDERTLEQAYYIQKKVHTISTNSLY